MVAARGRWVRITWTQLRHRKNSRQVRSLSGAFCSPSVVLFCPPGTETLRLPAFGPPPAWAGAGGPTRPPQAPCNPCPPRDCRNTLTRRPTGLARVARCAPKSPRANIQRLNISFSTTVSRWYCAARREASAVGGKAALRMKTAAISPERCEGSSRSKCRAAPCSSRCDAGALAVGELVSRNTASP